MGVKELVLTERIVLITAFYFAMKITMATTSSMTRYDTNIVTSEKGTTVGKKLETVRVVHYTQSDSSCPKFFD